MTDQERITALEARLAQLEARLASLQLPPAIGRPLSMQPAGDPPGWVHWNGIPPSIFSDFPQTISKGTP